MMPAPTVPALLAALVDNVCLDVSLLLRERAGELVGRIAARNPRASRALLVQLERAGFAGAGWALIALDLGAPSPRERAEVACLEALQLLSHDDARAVLATLRTCLARGVA